jgi:CxxC motif-containing protein
MNINRDLICVVCPVGCRLKISGTIEDMEVTGEKCKRGIDHAHEEITNPTRMVCTTVKIQGGIHNVIPVRTDKPIPEKYKLEVVKAVKDITLTSPIEMGAVIIEDIFGTGVNLIAERNM